MAEAAREEHERAVERLAASYAAIPRGETVRLAKPTTNLFRARSATTAPGLDVTGLTGVIDVDPGSPDRIRAFSNIIFEAGISAPVRTPRGRDIDAACGQLKTASERKRKSA